jgi:hypothetical protein
MLIEPGRPAAPSALNMGNSSPAMAANRMPAETFWNIACTDGGMPSTRNTAPEPSSMDTVGAIQIDMGKSEGRGAGGRRHSTLWHY